MSRFQKNVSKWIAWVLVAACAALPFSSSLANALGMLILVLWLVEGGLKEKWAAIFRNPVAVLPLVYFLILCLGLLWSSDLDWGLHVIKKSRRFLLLPVFLSVVAAHPQVLRRGLYAFLTSMAATAVVTLGIAFRLIAPFGHAHVKDPSPFVYHISYGPELAWAAYLCFAAVLFDSKLSKHWKTALCGAGALVLIGLFVNVGVAGYAAAFMLFGLLMLQWKQNILWLVLAMILLAGSAYFFSPAVHRRVDQNIQELRNVVEGSAAQENPTSGKVNNTSIGPRLVFWGNTWQLIKQHPVLGVGTGDFPAEYEKIRQQRTPDHWTEVDNPHNMYLMVWVQTGLLGLGVFLWFFAALFKQSRGLPKWQAHMAAGLICFMLLIMMSDAYMQIAPISLLFILFAGMFGGCSSTKLLIIHSCPIDQPGGAEISLREHLAAAPPGVTVDVALPDSPVDLKNYDTVVLVNLRPSGGLGETSEYRWAQLWIDRLRGYRGHVVRLEYDVHPCTYRDARCIDVNAPVWSHCDCESLIRRTFEKLYNLCDTVIFQSPLHRRAINHMIAIKGPRQIEISSPVDFDRFRPIVPFEERKRAALITGDAQRVAPDAVALAEAEGFPVEFVEYLSVPYEQMPDLLNQYQAVVVAPAMLHALGRLSIEAMACGCQVITNNRVGAMSWPDPVAASRNSNAAFWHVVTQRPLWPNCRRAGR